jgi:hypothetical protein
MVLTDRVPVSTMSDVSKINAGDGGGDLDESEYYGKFQYYSAGSGT